MSKHPNYKRYTVLVIAIITLTIACMFVVKDHFQTCPKFPLESWVFEAVDKKYPAKEGKPSRFERIDIN